MQKCCWYYGELAEVASSSNKVDAGEASEVVLDAAEAIIEIIGSDEGAVAEACGEVIGGCIID